ncbi:DUF2058 domain-containing protein [Acidihalobacter ferrooxydans]|uniref:Nucleoprotein/polynucleotide-associated enzyme n=1 Tax=Acidihalobacter ferrooxydans TaxID=1765967 RepID=A0A1P8UIF6_9GAMM|nr:DUF2058 domain-containing protein [Acidihalobacter ferrooxydans]APZ43612.1 hypothetical protein BW247_11380 [Acidihalobacter ferrooxydans]
MAGTLFDQLKQAGLVDDKKAQQVKREKHQQRKQAKGKQPSRDDAASTRAAKAAAQKAERDRQLNRERQQQLADKAEQAALRQMIEANRLSGWEGDLAHHFTDGKVIKTLYTTADIRARLAAGRVRIARCDGGYALLPSVTAEKIEQRGGTDVLIPLPQDTAPLTDEDREYYAKFEVPDDLIW